MNNRWSLNGSDWTVTGWWEHQWRLFRSMELGNKIYPASPPIPATVPGAVNADLMRAGRVPDPNVEFDSQAGEWVTNREWVYAKTFEVPAQAEGQRFFLHAEGLDHWGEIWLNETKLTEFEGMMIPVEVDITGVLQSDKPNELKVIFYRVPEVYGQYGYTSRIRHIKSRFNYIWDWCSRVVPVGIWDDIYIVSTGARRIQSCYPHARLLELDGTAELDLQLETNGEGSYSVECSLELQGEKIASIVQGGIESTEFTVKLPLKDVRLWWPRGYGEQPLYDVSVRVLDASGRESDASSRQVAFRRVEMGIEPDDSGPAARERAYTMRINGQDVFIQGVNWVPVSPLYGTVSRPDYERYIGRFRQMNVNLLRVWGGGILEKSDFYEICDRDGLLVWQELFQSSSGVENMPSDDPDFLVKLGDTSRTAIKRRRHHPSLVVWCGGNELLKDDFTPVSGDHPNLQMLEGIVAEENPDNLFIPASPWGPTFTADERDYGKGIHHDVHGPWDYTGDLLHYRYFNEDDALFRSELGTPGVSSMETLAYIAQRSPLWPPKDDNRLWLHHGAWWVQWEQLQALFGPWSEEDEDMKGYMLASQFIQAESLRYAAGAVQRRQPEAGGILIWMGNEPFANTANTSVIEFNGRPKLAYSALRNAFAPVHLSCRYERIGWQAGDSFRAEVYLHDARRELAQAEMHARIYTLDGKLLHEDRWGWNRGDAAAQERTDAAVWRLGETRWSVPGIEDGLFLYRIAAYDGGECLYEDTYVFTVDQEHPFAPLRKLPAVSLQASWLTEGTLQLSNESQQAAVMVYAEEERADELVDISPNALTLLPGESRVLRLTSVADGGTRSSVAVRLQGFNVETKVVRCEAAAELHGEGV